MTNIDEVALNVLLASGVDLPTALAGATAPEPQQPKEPHGFRPGVVLLGMLFGSVVVYVVVRLLL